MKKVIFTIWVCIGAASLGLLALSIAVFLTGDMCDVEELKMVRLMFSISLGVLILSGFTLISLAINKGLY